MIRAVVVVAARGNKDLYPGEMTWTSYPSYLPSLKGGLLTDASLTISLQTRTRNIIRIIPLMTKKTLVPTVTL